jgi:ABC-type branched-subunit amino acid transport system ATPase component
LTKGRATRPDGAPPPGPEPLFRIDAVDFSYGRLQVLFDVSLSVAAGQRVLVLGTNCAGKSTLLRLAAGVLRPDSGRVYFKGEDITDVAASERARLGMTLVEGGRSTFPSLTVAETLRLGALAVVRDGRVMAERLDSVLALFPQLEPRLAQKAGTLSGGEQQMLALGRALMAGADFLMIDELSLGLAPIVLRELVRAVEELARRGTTLLIVEQSLNLGLSLAQHTYVLEHGAVTYGGATAELLEHEELRSSVFFGTAGARS